MIELPASPFARERERLELAAEGYNGPAKSKPGAGKTKRQSTHPRVGRPGRLSDEARAAIADSAESAKALAELYGVEPKYINGVRHRERAKRGEVGTPSPRAHGRKLTGRQAAEVVADERPAEVVAAAYGVSPMTIYYHRRRAREGRIDV